MSIKKHEEQAEFYAHFRKPAFDGGYTIAAGLEGIIDWLNRFEFSESDIAYLKTLGNFSDEYLDYLKNMKFNLDVDAVPEGTAIVGNGPVIRFRGPLLQCQIAESMMLNILNSSSMVATCAARICSVIEKNGGVFADFALRRSPDRGVQIARSAFIGGCARTATAAAGKALGIPVTGTMAHAFIGAFQDGKRSNSEVERAAFEAFLRTNRGNVVLLVDTFNTLERIKNAIAVTIEENRKIQEQNRSLPAQSQIKPIALNGIRIDSGDLYSLTYTAQALIKEAAKEHPELFENTRIFLTDGLTVEKLNEFYTKAESDPRGPFPAKVFGVGTKLGNPGPLDGGVYKLSAIESNGLMVPTRKLTGAQEGDLLGSKTSLPGVGLDNVYLYRNIDGKKKLVGAVIVDESGLNENEAIRSNIGKDSLETLPTFDSKESLLVPIYRKGQLVYKKPTLQQIQAYAKEQRALLPEELQQLHPNRSSFPQFVTKSIYQNATALFKRNS